MNRLFKIIFLIIIWFGFTAVFADAKTKKIYAYNLIFGDSSMNYYQYPRSVRCADSNSCRWYKVVKLPVGSRVTKLKYYHMGSSHGFPYTEVIMKRVKMGELMQDLAQAESTDDSSQRIAVIDETIDYPVIKKGYTYYIEVICDNQYSYVFGIKILYQK